MLWMMAAALFLGGVYWMTLAPGLTWLHDSADGGDLITAAATAGIAHPTGYPLYLIIARIFQFLPFGELAFRTNILSAFFSILSALLVFSIVSANLLSSPYSQLPAFLSALFYGLAPLVWSQSVVTEVYTLNAFFVALLIWLTSSMQDVEGKFRDALLGGIFGLGMGNHLTIGLLFPLIFFPPFHQKRMHSFLTRVLGMAAGLTVYLILPLRAMLAPVLNWGDPRTLQNFIWLVSGSLYQEQVASMNLLELIARIRAAAGLLLAQFGILGLCLGLLGVVVYFKPVRLYWNTLWVGGSSLLFALLYATFDSYVYLIPAFLCFAVWIGLGIGELLQKASRPFWGALLILLVVVCLGGQTFRNWPVVDASRDVQAQSFSQEVMQRMPDSALVFVRGDRAIFTLWYFHYALGGRPDLAVIAPDLLPYAWYREGLAHNYASQDLVVKQQRAELILHNPGRAVCAVEYLGLAEISCQP